MYTLKINNKTHSIDDLELNLNKFINLNRFVKIFNIYNSKFYTTKYASKILYHNKITNICNFNNIIYSMIVYNNPIRKRNYYIQNNTLNNKLILFNAIDTISLNKYNLLINIALKKKIISESYIKKAISYRKKIYYIGKLGVALSHINVWNKFKFLPNKWILILEDDCYIKKINVNIDSFINNCINEVINIKPDCKYIKLHINNFNKKKQFSNSNKISGNIYKPIIPNCSNVAYLLHKDGIDIINKHLYPLKTFFDHSISYLFNHLNAIIYKNSIFINMGADSKGDNNTLFGSIIFNNTYK